jgi:hypothetical protein
MGEIDLPHLLEIVPESGGLAEAALAALEDPAELLRTSAVEWELLGPAIPENAPPGAWAQGGLLEQGGEAGPLQGVPEPSPLGLLILASLLTGLYAGLRNKISSPSGA